VLGAGVVLTASTAIVDVTGPEPVEHRGPRPGAQRGDPRHAPEALPRGGVHVPCALIIGRAARAPTARPPSKAPCASTGSPYELLSPPRRHAPRLCAIPSFTGEEGPLCDASRPQLRGPLGERRVARDGHSLVVTPRAPKGSRASCSRGTSTWCAPSTTAPRASRATHLRPRRGRHEVGPRGDAHLLDDRLRGRAPRYAPTFVFYEREEGPTSRTASATCSNTSPRCARSTSPCASSPAPTSSSSGAWAASTRGCISTGARRTARGPGRARTPSTRPGCSLRAPRRWPRAT
jgi:hypothetical protein